MVENRQLARDLKLAHARAKKCLDSLAWISVGLIDGRKSSIVRALREAPRLSIRLSQYMRVSSNCWGQFTRAAPDVASLCGFTATSWHDLVREIAAMTVLSLCWHDKPLPSSYPPKMQGWRWQFAFLSSPVFRVRVDRRWKSLARELAFLSELLPCGTVTLARLGRESVKALDTVLLAEAVSDAASKQSDEKQTKGSGQSDTKSDKKPGKKKRVPTDAARACCRAYRLAIANGDKRTQRLFCQEWTAENGHRFKNEMGKPPSWRTIERALQDHPELWKPAADTSDKSSDTAL